MGPVAEERTYLGSVVVEQAAGGQRQVRYQHVDRLGSPDAVTNELGQELTAEGHGFDAFGGPRGREWQSTQGLLQPGGAFGTTTTRGFTGHEQLDDTQLTHMNGRVYDSALGRFLSVDPVISNPASSQALNPYSYIGNNPLSGVDPTGYEAEGVSGACTVETGTHIAQCGGGGGGGGDSSAGASSNNGAQRATGVVLTRPVHPDVNSPTQVGILFKTEVFYGDGTRDAPTYRWRPSEPDMSQAEQIARNDVGAHVVWGWAFGGREATTGKNAVTGEPMSMSQRVAAGVSSVLFVGGLVVSLFAPPLGLSIAGVGELGQVALSESRTLVVLRTSVVGGGGSDVAAGGGPALARELGAAGEAAAGIAKNTTRIPSLTSTANYRIPDVLSREARLIGEVKNVANLSYTRQLRDFSTYAQQQGFRFELTVRQGTQLSCPLQQAVNAGDISLLRTLP